jgi:alpha-1,3-rhamnosyl/mannosyltransferase
MRVLVNGFSTVGARTGVGHYTAELVRCLAPLMQNDQLLCFRPGWARCKTWLTPLQRHAESPEPSANAVTRPVPSWRASLLSLLRRLGRAAFGWQLRREARRTGCQLYHEPNFIPHPCDLPTVVTVHDLSVLLHPEWHPADRVAMFQRQFARHLGQAQHVLAISEAARQEIIHTLHVPPERVTRTYMGTRAGLQRLPEGEVRKRLRELGLPQQYLLVLGTIEPRKNVLMLLRAYVSLPLAVRKQYPLLLVGGWGWNSADVRTYLHDEARHRGVRYLGYVAEETVPLLYNGARALLFPTLYEGFGMPPIEMMACGGAVIGSTAPAVVETVGRRACLLDPHDEDAWRQALLRVCRDEEWWSELRQGVEEIARPFTWEQCAADTLAVYRRVLSAEETAPLPRAA